ncbi:hypothetical protein LOAG_03301 [Loa loa]|uniref:Uncharacterized protein n=1 Tax=Loa loa TaxID=7209 RepID=A0A1S0U5I8_LOALO|nr:hypothetical protein LOAG_03301 [Loa loa]EFO25187.1 hypothetical protein LOAG_03301 [Loa loa]
MNNIVDGRSFSFLITLIAVNTIVYSYSIPRQKSYHQLDLMIKRCFRTVCKDWIHECHWFCDLAKGRLLSDSFIKIRIIIKDYSFVDRILKELIYYVTRSNGDKFRMVHYPMKPVAIKQVSDELNYRWTVAPVIIIFDCYWLR